VTVEPSELREWRIAGELEALKHAVRRMLRAEERAFEAQGAPWNPDYNDLEGAWWKAHVKHRTQVEQLLEREGGK